MHAHEKYGIRPGQHYKRADGSSETLVVLDVDSHAADGDIVVSCAVSGRLFKIDAFKLACVRYYLDPIWLKDNQ